MNEQDFLNLYIQNLVKEVEELIKTKVFLDTKVQYNEKVAEEIATNSKELQDELEKQDAIIKTWETSDKNHEDKVSDLVKENTKLQKTGTKVSDLETENDRLGRECRTKGETIASLHTEVLELRLKVEELKKSPIVTLPKVEVPKKKTNSSKATLPLE